VTRKIRTSFAVLQRGRGFSPRKTLTWRCTRSAWRSRFNEAVAFHHGRRSLAAACSSAFVSFNEAVAFHHGRRASAWWTPAPGCCFNEAVAFHHGRRELGGQ